MERGACDTGKGPPGGSKNNNILNRRGGRERTSRHRVYLVSSDLHPRRRRFRGPLPPRRHRENLALGDDCRPGPSCRRRRSVDAGRVRGAQERRRSSLLRDFGIGVGPRDSADRTALTRRDGCRGGGDVAKRLGRDRGVLGCGPGETVRRGRRRRGAGGNDFENDSLRCERGEAFGPWESVEEKKIFGIRGVVYIWKRKAVYIGQSLPRRDEGDNRGAQERCARCR